MWDRFTATRRRTDGLIAVRGGVAAVQSVIGEGVDRPSVDRAE
jgi:hypothetical protein